MINWTVRLPKLGRKFLKKRVSLFVFTMLSRNVKKIMFSETELIQFLVEIKSTTGIKRLISIKTSVAILLNLKEKQTHYSKQFSKSYVVLILVNRKKTCLFLYTIFQN